MQCIVVADDLTGANATGVLMTKINFRTYTVMNDEGLDVNNLSNCECVVYPTNSRSIDPECAYDKVAQTVDMLKCGDIKVYSKRIDTTLRGNLGSETDAMLDTLADARVAMIVPCFPTSGRIIVGGYLLVGGIPLHKTEVAMDPKTPVHTPLCAEIFQKQSKYPVASIMINDIMKGHKHVAELIKDYAKNGVRNIVFDSISQEDIDLVAEAVVESKVPFIAVDPGVFTATIARKLIPLPTEENGKKPRILVTVGSVNAVASRQVEHFLASQETLNVFIEAVEFLEGDERRNKEVARVADTIINNCDDYELCSVIGRGVVPEGRIDLKTYADKYGCTFEEISNMINTAIAEITYRIASSDKNFKGFYSCGGDITVAICKQMKTLGLKLLGEVLPLAAYGEMMGGEFPGLKIVTKGGMVGDNESIVTCVRYLKEKLSM